MRYFIGWWRMLFNFCPECNSDAPAIDNCPVCRNYRGYVDKAIKAKWWKKFVAKPTKSDHMIPIDAWGDTIYFDRHGYEDALEKWRIEV